MHSNHVLVFDVGGEYGHFRKFNTTTSPLTYSIPPRTALIGMIGAILGIEREIGIGKFKKGQVPLADLLAPDKADLAVQILNPTSKVMMAFNLLNTKTSFFNIENRTQIEFELLKNPKFRVFIRWENTALFTQLEEKLSNKHSDFTVSLGLSQHLADVSYVGKYAIHKMTENDAHTSVISAVKLNALDPLNPIQFNQEFKYISDTMPIYMTSERIVKEYAEVIVEANGKPILVKSDHVFKVEAFGNIQFL